MATLNQLIELSARSCQLLAHGQTMTAEMQADMLTLFNFMLEELRGKGVDLGITNLAATDEIYIDQADYMPLHYMLTVRACDHYGRQPSAVKFDLAERAENVIFARYYQNTELNIPVGLQPTESFDIDL